MRIDPNLYVAPVTQETAAKPQPSKGSGRSAGASVVALSSAGAAVVADPDHSPPSPRVDKLKMMVDAGTYHVDMEALAFRIVDDEVVRGTKK